MNEGVLGVFCRWRVKLSNESELGWRVRLLSRVATPSTLARQHIYREQVWIGQKTRLEAPQQKTYFVVEKEPWERATIVPV